MSKPLLKSEPQMRLLLVLFGLFLIVVQVLMPRPGSYDVISYIAAADVFVRGGDPYGAAILATPRYDGLPFVYPPGTLWMFAPLAWLPTKIVMILDGVARLVAFAWATVRLSRRHLPKVMPEHVLMLTLLLAPVLNAIVAANWVVYCYAAFVGCVVLCDREEITARHYVAAALCGVVLAVKPMWLVAGFVFAARRRWRLLGAFAGGVALLAAASLAQWDLVLSWLHRVDELRHAFRLADLPTLTPRLYVVLVVVWLAFTAWLWVKHRDHPALELHACTSVLIWPRCDIHTHLVVLWLIAWVWQTRGARTALAMSSGLLLVLPGVLRGLGIEMLGDGWGWYPEILAYYASTLALSLALWSTLLSSRD